MKRSLTLTFLSVILILSLFHFESHPVQAATLGYSLRFRGHGTADIDRVKIKLDAPAVPADVSGNFTVEFWLRATLADNASAACTPGEDNWINGNIMVDRDVYGDGDSGDYGISLSNGKIAFGVSKGTSKQTICGATNVANNKWHHIAVTRSSATGLMRIFVDGKNDASGTGPTGNISYRNARITSYPNSDPYLVLGAEKHDVGAAYPSYNGYMDELRISKSIRYTANFTRPTSPFTADPNTAALYHFDEGPAGICAGAVLDSSTAGTSDGQCKYGGVAPKGPIYATTVPFTAVIPPPLPGGGPELEGCPMYPADNIWNVRVDSLPVHARSTAWVNSIGRNTGFHMDFGSPWNGHDIGIPYNIVDGSTVTKYNVDFYESPDESDDQPYPIPANPKIEDASDSHILIVDRETCKLYELYAAYYNGGQWHAGSGAIWDLNSHDLRPDGWTSADAAGLPILPGLVLYDEVTAGVINHAIRFTVSDTQRAYLWPARHYASDITDANVPPMGARFRLREDYDISGFDPKMRVILQAMKTYGIIIADNGSDWYVSGAPDDRWDNDMLHTLDVLTGDDFEAVDVSSLMINANSGQAKAANTRWNPSIGDSIQIQYAGALDTTKNVDIYNLDMEDTTIAQVSALHAKGRKVMCYINAGAWEEWRADADDYPLEILGNDYDGWPGEKWVDIRRIDLLAPILRARLDQCKSKGFDGVDPDNVTGFMENTGFPLTALDQIIFNKWLAGEAHARGLSIGLKNDTEQQASLLNFFDWGLTEDCFVQGWCADSVPFISAGKPVFAVEYSDNGINFNGFCAQVMPLGISGIYKNRNLNAYLKICP
jgi:hypothetical protein